MDSVILKSLLTDGDYFGKVYTSLKPSHFNGLENTEIFNALQNYIMKYDTRPNIKELGLFIKQSSKLTDQILDKVIGQYKTVMLDGQIDNKEFLIDETEKYIQKLELSEAIFKSADIIQNDEPFEQVVGMVEDALSVTFESDVGLIYSSSAEDRFEYYTQKMQGVPIGLPSVDHALGSGMRSKTLNIVVAPSHGGKSALLVSAAAQMRLNGKKVLFVSLEMTEFEIAKRIDANLLGISANDFGKTKKEVYLDKIKEINSMPGEMVIKEYPAGTFNTIKLRSLLGDLENEKGFIPEVICIDYIGLMASSRVTLAQAGGSYAYFKAISEELHGFGKKEDKVMISAAQLNRGSYDNLEAGLDSIADSLGVIQTADTVLAILANGQLREMNQALLKFLKNRNTGELSSHLVEVDFSMSRFTDMDEGTFEPAGAQQSEVIGVPELSMAVQHSLAGQTNDVLNFD